jgi:hypothetical protein
MSERLLSKISALSSVRGALLAAVVLALVVLVKSPILSSYWLDETITYWIIRDGLMPAFSRAWSYQGQSPLYFLIARLAYLGGGLTGLRLFSFALTAGSAAILFQIAAKRWGREAGAYAALAFVALDGVIRVSFTARPYALALLLALASVRFLDDWMARGDRNSAARYAAATVLCFYAHYLFAGIILVHAAMLWKARPESDAVLKRWLAMAPLCALIMAPGVIQLYWLSHHGAGLSFAGKPGAVQLVKALFPVDFCVFLGCALLLARIFAPFEFRKPGGTLAVILMWWLVPPAAFWIISQVGGGSLFVDRLYVWHQPAIALAAAALFTAMQNTRARSIALATFVAMAGVRQIGRVWFLEDWRDTARVAAAASVKGAPVLAFTGLIESDSVSWLEDPARREYLSTPFSLYPVQTQLILLPGGFRSEPALQYFKDEVQPAVANYSEFMLIALHIRRFPAGAPSYFADEELAGFLQSYGFQLELVSDPDNLVRTYKVRRAVPLPSVS